MKNVEIVDVVVLREFDWLYYAEKSRTCLLDIESRLVKYLNVVKLRLTLSRAIPISIDGPFGRLIKIVLVVHRSLTLNYSKLLFCFLFFV